MSIAKNLSAYIDALLQETASDFQLGVRLASAQDRIAYAASVHRRARSASRPNDLEKSGTDNYKLLLNTIDTLADNRGCGTGIPASLWRKLKTLMLMLGARADWANYDTGPIYGGSNETLAHRLDLSIDRTKKTLKELRILGLIIDHDRLANGRRRIRRNADGNPYGHGISLLPLIIRLDELRDVAAAYLDRKKQSLKLKRQASAALRQAKALIAHATLHEHPATSAIESVTESINAALKARDTSALEEICNDLLPIKTTRQGVATDPPHTTAHLAAGTVDGTREARSGTGSAKTSNEDPYGLSSAQITISELQTLFPVTSIAIAGSRDMLETGARLARQSGIGDKMWDRAIRKLGPSAAPYAVIIYAQHLADGQIRNTGNPQSYFAGMLNAADRADLNLGATIWGRREQAGTHYARS